MLSSKTVDCIMKARKAAFTGNTCLVENALHPAPSPLFELNVFVHKFWGTRPFSQNETSSDLYRHTDQNPLTTLLDYFFY